MKLLQRWPLCAACITLLVGIAMGSTGARVVLLASVAFLLFLSLVGLVTSSRTPHLRAWLIVGMVLALGSLYGAARTMHAPMIVELFDVRSASATVVSNSAIHGSSQRAYLDLRLVAHEQSIRVRARIPAEHSIRYGDVVTVSGTLMPPRDDETFYETGFLHAHHARGTLQVEELELAGERAGNPLLRALHDVRSLLLARLEGIRTPERSVIAGVILGEASALPDWLEEAFRRTGTTHMLVASGANVVVLAWMVEHLLAIFGVRIRMLLTSVLLVGFVVITGGDASILRAVLLYLIVLLAALTGRRVHMPTLIAVVATAMALVTPWAILYDASFQLSFAAVIGLVVLSDWLAEYLPTWWLKEFLAPTVAAQLATLPIILFSFGQLSIVAPLVNLVVGPIVLPLMVAGIGTLLAPWLSFIPWLAEGIARLLVLLVRLGASVPWASITTETQRLLWSVVAVLVFAAVLFLRYRRPTKKEG